MAGNRLIFPTTIGTTMATRNMDEDYRKLLRRIGLPAIRFHDLRHTAATLKLQQGVHPKIVQERQGHADFSMALNTYSHVFHPGKKKQKDYFPPDQSDGRYSSF